jgi:hypothetical protein
MALSDLPRRQNFGRNGERMAFRKMDRLVGRSYDDRRQDCAHGALCRQAHRSRARGGVAAEGQAKLDDLVQTSSPCGCTSPHSSNRGCAPSFGAQIAITILAAIAVVALPRLWRSAGQGTSGGRGAQKGHACRRLREKRCETK